MIQKLLSMKGEIGARRYHCGRGMVFGGTVLAAPPWDRHLVPLPGARIAIVYGEPIMVDRHAEVDEALRSRVADALDVAEQRDWAILNSHSTLPTAQRSA